MGTSCSRNKTTNTSHIVILYKLDASLSSPIVGHHIYAENSGHRQFHDSSARHMAKYREINMATLQLSWLLPKQESIPFFSKNIVGTHRLQECLP